MSQDRVSNRRIKTSHELLSPREVKREVSRSLLAEETVINAREQLKRILLGEEKRLVVVTGPCSIHDLESAREYAQRLKKVSERVNDKMLLVMRTYFEKPRTVDGWKGILNDPHINNTFKIDEGIILARRLLVEISEWGVPCATEMLDLIMPQYLSDLISWTAIGARTTESQTHRELASGLSMPVGFKNGTDGNVQVAINAICSAAKSHHFLSVSEEGRVSIFETSGNQSCHVVLRGGKKPNYHAEDLNHCEEQLKKAHLPAAIMVDCSHGNSDKDHRKQGQVFRACIEEKLRGRDSLFALMLESHIHEGKQPVHDAQLKYGVSVTDACISWEETEDLLLEAHSRL